MFFYCWIYYPLKEGHTGDFLNRLRGGESFNGQTIYWDGKGIDVYGPLFTLLDYGLHEGGLNQLMVVKGLFIFYLTIHLAGSFLMLKLFGFWNGSSLKRGIGIFLIVNFFPFIQAVRQNVIENLQFFSVILFLCFLTSKLQQRQVLSGIALGVAVCAKTIPILLVPYLLLRKQRRVVAAALIVFLLAATVASTLKEVTLLEGLKGIFFFKNAMEGLNFHQNQALSGFVYRLFVDFDFHSLSALTHPQIGEQKWVLYKIVYYPMLFLIVLWTALRVTPVFHKTFRRESKELFFFEVSIIFALFLLGAPHTEIYYFILILPAYLLLFDRLFSKPGNRFWKWALTLSYLLVGLRSPLRILDIILPLPVACPYIQLTNILNFPFYGVVLLLVLLVHFYRQTGREKIKAFPGISQPMVK